MSIKIQSITKTYGAQKAVNNISFEIQKGEIVGFIGPNGAGKSTTMKILTGFLSPDSGEAFINGLNVKSHSQEIKRSIGYLPEHNPLYPEMYVVEYLEYVEGLYGGGSESEGERGEKKSESESESEGERGERVDGRWGVERVIELTGLQREKHKKIEALSKGYQQRVGLAQAMIHNPDVLILDEPTSGLDPGQIIEIRNLILSLGKEKTILLSTHLMQEVEAICDRVIMINKGEIVADGLASEIGSAKEDVATILLELDKIPETELLSKIDGVIKIKSLDENHLLIESDAGKDIRPLLFSFAVENGLTILSMQKKERSLEEVFQELVK